MGKTRSKLESFQLGEGGGSENRQFQLKSGELSRFFQFFERVEGVQIFHHIEFAFPTFGIVGIVFIHRGQRGHDGPTSQLFELLVQGM